MSASNACLVSISTVGVIPMLVSFLYLILYFVFTILATEHWRSGAIESLHVMIITESRRSLPAEYCIVGIPHNTAIYLTFLPRVGPGQSPPLYPFTSPTSPPSTLSFSIVYFPLSNSLHLFSCLSILPEYSHSVSGPDVVEGD